MCCRTCVVLPHLKVAVWCAGISRLAELAALLPKQLMLRWLNHHIRTYITSPEYVNDEGARKLVPPDLHVGNFGTDLADSVALSVVLHEAGRQVAPCELFPLAQPNKMLRAAHVVANLKKLRVDDRGLSFQPTDVVTPRPRIVQLMVGRLMHDLPALSPVPAGTRLQLRAALCGDPSDERELQAFTAYVSSLGLMPPSNDVCHPVEAARNGCWQPGSSQHSTAPGHFLGLLGLAARHCRPVLPLVLWPYRSAPRAARACCFCG